MRKMVLVVAGLCVVLCASGCATIISGKNQDVHVTSDPPGVQVKTETGVTITAPGDLTLPRNKNHTLVAQYGDAPAQQRDLQSNLNGWVFGNILVGGLFGIVIDFASGAYGTRTPGAVHFDLTEAGQAALQRKMDYLHSHPETSERIRLAILNDRPLNGMSREVLVVALGEPDQIVTERKYEKYVYENHNPRYYYIRNDRIERITK
jgi:hypothetical protein